MVGLREHIVVHGFLGEVQLRAQALLDTGNGNLTVITRGLAERLALVDRAGMPRQVPGAAVRQVTVRGVVAHAEEQQVVLPSVR
jgi:hypothetical protein